ncbi:MAG: hypothetical protein IT238_04040 [Bacteroidia bacterium]|nr:hypothetical protein [Bacteroidia bacterium]MCZ2247242.1 hypothetical protein [Bacteroidia bacterium]
MISTLRVKNILFGVLWVSVLFVASCAPEPSEEPEPDYSGSWTCNETATNPAGTSSFTVKLVKVGTASSEYKIQNFYNLGFNNEAKVSIGTSGVYMSSQTIGSGNSAFTASGSGTVNSTAKFSMNYEMSDGSGDVDACSATFTKQ